MRISIIGAPGSGKTTQANLLAKPLGVPVFSLGKELRRVVEEGGPKASEIKKILEEGGLVPDEMTLDVLRERLMSEDTSRGFILDGMPRTIGEARAMSQIFALNKVFHLQVGVQAATERLLRRGREDDKPELMQRRFDLYNQNIKPIIAFYRSLGALIEIDASSSSIQDINREIMSKLQ
ncbi:AAA family ATPase [Candidatus Saccharibacteria bacterium]|nr:AAA family ATPase [Candidatus Saccharibacteria bacterium]